MQFEAAQIPIHTPEQVQAILTDAARIAGELSGEGENWRAYFEQACALLGQRHTVVAAPQTMPLPAMAVPRLRGH